MRERITVFIVMQDHNVKIQSGRQIQYSDKSLLLLLVDAKETGC